MLSVTDHEIRAVHRERGAPDDHAFGVAEGSRDGPAANRDAITPARGGFVQVAYRLFAVSPARITVHRGQRIKWTNYDLRPHDVVAQSGPARFASPPIGKGGTYVFTPIRTGVIHYVCEFHPASMKGAIYVVS